MLLKNTNARALAPETLIYLSGRVPGICSFERPSNDFNVQLELRIIRLNDIRLHIKLLKKKKKLTFFPQSTSSANLGKVRTVL